MLPTRALPVRGHAVAIRRMCPYNGALDPIGQIHHAYSHIGDNR
jgi:hypothetical protein